MIKHQKIIAIILADYKSIFADDFKVYKNHIYRIFNYAIIFDNSSKNIEKYAITVVFHDIGIWTHSFNYLEPSVELAKE